MTPNDVRLTAQLVVGDRVHCVSDEAVKALAARVLELEAQAQHPLCIGQGDPIQWTPVPDDVVVAVCVEYRKKVVEALKAWMEKQRYGGYAGGPTWVEVIESVRMLK